MRVTFTRKGGLLRFVGSVGYLFDCKDHLAIECDGLTIDEDTMLEKVLEIGGDIYQLIFSISVAFFFSKILKIF